MDLAFALRALRALEAVRTPLADGDEHDAEVALSIAYLRSEAATKSLAIDPYWPKWDSPWWHMLLLHERGEASKIPPEAALALARSLDRMPLKIFPTRPSDIPAGLDPSRDASCHCALGCIAPLLLACGVDVDRELPWVRDWFAKYQMSDGGLTCDWEAYHLAEEPSSMVGTLAPLEALLALTAVDPRAEDLATLDRMAEFAMGRALVRGSDTVVNADERRAALSWPELSFPRFYFYDVLRGLEALVAWARAREKPIRWSAIREVVASMIERFPDGRVRVGRRAFEGAGTRLRDESGVWTTGHRESTFPLLEVSSVVGAESRALGEKWRVTREGLLALARAGAIDDR